MNAKVRATVDLKSKLLERYAEQIDGILGCYDRMIMTGTFVDVAHPDVLTARLYALNIRCFDLKLFAEPLRDQVRDNAILLARQSGPGNRISGTAGAAQGRSHRRDSGKAWTSPRLGAYLFGDGIL